MGGSPGPALARAVEERVIHSEVQALRLNGLILVGFPGEVFAQMGVKLKPEVQNYGIVVVELANDNVGYIPPREIFEEGGYEVAQHLWGRVTPAATEKLMAAGRRVIGRLVGSDSEE